MNTLFVHGPGSAAPAAMARRPALTTRLAVAGVVLALEKSLMNLAVDFEAASRAQDAGSVLRVVQHFGLRFAVTFAVALALLAWVSADARLSRANQSARDLPLRWPALILHGTAMLGALALLHTLYEPQRLLPIGLQAVLAVVLALLGFIALLVAMAPPALWRELAAALGRRWGYAGVAACVAVLAFQLSDGLWSYTAGITFELVRHVLDPLLPGLQADVPSRTLRTGHFAVQIADVCSGLEGVGLVLAFTLAWLAYFRREYRFPQALVLIPAGVFVIFVLNVLRIAGLVLIGDAGYPDVAQYGFHSQAGWIAFNVTACAVAIVSRRSSWISRAPATMPAHAASENPTAAFVLPFLVVLGTAILARASSGSFAGLAPLRLLTGAIALWFAWPALRALQWRCSWRGPLAGVLVWAIWLLAEHLLLAPGQAPSALEDWDPGLRSAWIAAEVLTSATLVPVVEELAYRGYLMRRLASAGFDTLPFQAVGMVPLLISAVVFGIGHGALWPAGIAAGLVYGSVLIRSGRIGDAVVAHATTNALLAAWGLLFGDWNLL